MKHIYYFFACACILWEVLVITEPKKVMRFRERYKEKKKVDEMNSTEKSYTFFTLFYWIWLFVGLMTFQWPLFLFIILCAAFIPKKYLILSWLDSILTCPVLIFIIINKYHLHIDVYRLIIK